MKVASYGGCAGAEIGDKHSESRQRPKCKRNRHTLVASTDIQMDAPPKPLTQRTSDVLLPPDASLATILDDLERQDFRGLCMLWRNHLGGKPPTQLPTWLFVRLMAYHLQVVAFGDLEKSTRRLIENKSRASGVPAPPFDRRAPQFLDGIALKPGALLVREWQGRLERVTVLEQGFSWNGKNFDSLSKIAKAMTGTKWNGHRFFGLHVKDGNANEDAVEMRGRRFRGVSWRSSIGGDTMRAQEVFAAKGGESARWRAATSANGKGP
jgi:Protein of unknown function (DUF2924)